MRSVLSARTMLSSIVAAALAVGLVAAPASAQPVAPQAVAAPAAAPTAPAGVLSGIAKGLHGFDSLTAPTQAQLEAQISCLSANGYSFDMVNTNGDGWQGQYNAAAAAGLKVVLFQGYDPDAWKIPTEATRRAQASRDKALAAKYPRGGQIYLDLEDNVGRGVDAAHMITWIKDWADVIRKAGFSPGVYVGYPQLLSAAQLDAIPQLVFWRSASTAAPQVARGFTLQQSPAEFEMQHSPCAAKIDGDYAATDKNDAGLLGAAFPKPLPAPTAAGAFAPLSPVRIVDTRSGTGAAGPVAGGRTVDIQVTGRGGVPAAGAAAVVLTVTATAPTASGYLSVFPSGAARAQVSSLNFIGRQTVANLVTVRLGAGGKVSLFNGSGGTIQILADVAGYYLAGSATQPGTFTPVVPARLLDTRPASVAALSRTTVGTAAKSPIPAGGYDAAVLNVTAVQPAAAGFLIAYAAGPAAPPTASNLNFPVGRTVPNMATVPVDTSGKVLLYNGSKGRTDLLADIAGYYRSGTRVDRGAFTPRTPARVLDTRSKVGDQGGKVAPASAIALKVAGLPSVPTGSSAVVLNVTVVHAGAAGFLTVFPSDRSTPQASNINFVAGLDVADQVVVPIGADGKVVLLNSSAGATDLIADVAGYIRG